MSYGKISESSQDTVVSSLDLFKTPDTKTSTLKGNTVEIGPLRNPDGSQIEFEYQSDGFNYIDLENCLLHVQAKVTKADGSAVTGTLDNLNVMPVSNLFHCLFSIVQMSLGDHDIEYEANYPYLAYLETLLSRDVSYKKTIAQSSQWIEDGIGPLDTAEVTDADGDLIKARKKLISGSKTMDLVGRLHISFLTQDRYLPTSTTLKLKLTRSDPNFCLVRTDATDTTNYKIEITKCSLLIRQVQVNPSIINVHNSLHMSGNKMKYPINKIDTQMFAISQGKQSERLNLIINRQCPKRIFVSFIDHDAKNGSIAKDPFKFPHYGLRSIALDVDGVPVPTKPIQMNFDENKFTLPYFNLALSTGKAFSNHDHGITREMFKDGYGIFAFDLTPDWGEGGGMHLIRNSSVSLDVTFKAALTNTISVFVYSERDDLIEIDNQRTIHRLSRL